MSGSYSLGNGLQKESNIFWIICAEGSLVVRSLLNTRG